MTKNVCEQETVKRNGYEISDQLKRLSSKGFQIQRNVYARGTTPGTILTHVEPLPVLKYAQHREQPTISGTDTHEYNLQMYHLAVTIPHLRTAIPLMLL